MLRQMYYVRMRVRALLYLWNRNSYQLKIDLIEGNSYSQESLLCISYFWSKCPFLHIFPVRLSVQFHSSETVIAINLKLHMCIDLIKDDQQTYKSLLCIKYFWSYCPLLYFIFLAFVRALPYAWNRKNYQLETSLCIMHWEQITDTRFITLHFIPLQLLAF